MFESDLYNFITDKADSLLGIIVTIIAQSNNLYRSLTLGIKQSVEKKSSMEQHRQVSRSQSSIHSFKLLYDSKKIL